MLQNMGTLDRALRAAVALVVAVRYLTGTISGTAALVLGAVAFVFALTSVVGTCPAYLPFGLSTRGKTPA